METHPPIEAAEIARAEPKLVPLVLATMASQALVVTLSPTTVAVGRDLGASVGRRAWDAIAEVRHFSSRSYEWILEADIKACFDELSHSAILDQVRRRVADKRVLALIKAFMKAGILTEQGTLERTITGTPQGGILSPLMANVALSVLDQHYARAWEAMGQKWHQRDAIRRRGGGDLPTYSVRR